MYKSVVKRVLDFLLALAGTIVLSPLLLVLAAWVKLCLLYTSSRPHTGTHHAADTFQ